MIHQVIVGIIFLVALGFMLRKVAAPMMQNQTDQSSVNKDSFPGRRQ